MGCLSAGERRGNRSSFHRWADTARFCHYNLRVEMQIRPCCVNRNDLISLIWMSVNPEGGLNINKFINYSYTHARCMCRKQRLRLLKLHTHTRIQAHAVNVAWRITFSNNVQTLFPFSICCHSLNVGIMPASHAVVVLKFCYFGFFVNVSEFGFLLRFYCFSKCLKF